MSPKCVNTPKLYTTMDAYVLTITIVIKNSDYDNKKGKKGKSEYAIFISVESKNQEILFYLLLCLISSGF